MALTPSTMLPLGTAAPDFDLPDTTGKSVSLAGLKSSSALLVVFMCNHCPYVVHIRAGLAQLTRDYARAAWLSLALTPMTQKITRRTVPAKMKEEVANAGYTFPYLYDETQAVAKSYRAACTPDFFLFDRGAGWFIAAQFDASRPGNGMPVTGKDLRTALDAVLSGRTTSEFQVPSMGCNIKWKSGNEPDYF